MLASNYDRLDESVVRAAGTLSNYDILSAVSTPGLTRISAFSRVDSESDLRKRLRVRSCGHDSHEGTQYSSGHLWNRERWSGGRIRSGDAFIC